MRLPDSRPAYAIPLICLLLCLSLQAGCASKNKGAEGARSDDFGIPAMEETTRSPSPHAKGSLDDYDENSPQSIADPLEPWNRFWFHFNDIFYLHVARPLYRCYDFVMPREFQSGLKNFLANIMFPIRFINSLLQGKPQAAGVEFGRFLVNTTVGFGGFIDAAKGRRTVVPVDSYGEDFGQTMGYWGIGDGFYLVWPIIGPSSVRDTIGRAGDTLLTPTFHLQSLEASLLVNGTLRFNALGDILTNYEDAKGLAVDPYIAMREAYAGFRKAHIRK